MQADAFVAAKADNPEDARIAFMHTRPSDAPSTQNRANSSHALARRL